MFKRMSVCDYILKVCELFFKPLVGISPNVQFNLLAMTYEISRTLSVWFSCDVRVNS